MSQKPSELGVDMQFQASFSCKNEECRRKRMSPLASIVIQRRKVADYISAITPKQIVIYRQIVTTNAKSLFPTKLTRQTIYALF